MNKETSKEIINYLNRLKNIYLLIDEKLLVKDITKLNEIMKDLEKVNEKTKTTSNQKKKSFQDYYQLLLQRNFFALNGTKLNYQEFLCQENIVKYVENNSKTKILKDTTALDLKLLYSLLTEDPTEVKGNKSEVFDAIKRNIRARKRGEAFMKTT